MTVALSRNSQFISISQLDVVRGCAYSSTDGTLPTISFLSLYHTYRTPHPLIMSAVMKLVLSLCLMALLLALAYATPYGYHHGYRPYHYRPAPIMYQRPMYYGGNGYNDDFYGGGSPYWD